MSETIDLTVQEFHRKILRRTRAARRIVYSEIASPMRFFGWGKSETGEENHNRWGVGLNAEFACFARNNVGVKE